MSEVVKSKRVGGILEVTLDRPKADAIDLPTHVTLKEKQGKSYKCEVCWQHGKKLGVRFI